MSDKFLSLLGFASKAGKIAAGEDAASAAVRGGTARLVLLSSAAGPNTAKKLRDACSHHGAPLIECGGEAMAAAGKHGRVVLCVTDEGFAARLMELWQLDND